MIDADVIMDADADVANDAALPARIEKPLSGFRVGRFFDFFPVTARHFLAMFIWDQSFKTFLAETIWWSRGVMVEFPVFAYLMVE